MATDSTLRRKKLRPTIEKIHFSMENGEDEKALDEIRQHGVKDFFTSYDDWLSQNNISIDWYVRAVKLYHGRTRYRV